MNDITLTTNATNNDNVVIYLGLGLSSSHILLDIGAIKAITPLADCQSIPLVKPWVRGISNWRGKFLTVVDVSELFGGASQRCLNQNQIIVVEYENSFYGLLFQSIDEKFHVTADLWKKHPHNDCVGAIRSCVDGHVMINNKPWHGFNLTQLFENSKFYNILATT